tara:strand:+ start:739 stop:960 length:222 start_codon:yes stop_codon:yes gene_type:complete
MTNSLRVTKLRNVNHELLGGWEILQEPESVEVLWNEIYKDWLVIGLSCSWVCGCKTTFVTLTKIVYNVTGIAI